MSGPDGGGRPPARPAVTVVVPFTGSDTALFALVRRLGTLVLAPDDTVLVLDNRRQPPPDTGARITHPRIRWIHAGGIASPGFARNRGAAAARTDWLVFLDADTAPAPDLLDRYFDPAPRTGTAVLAGGIDDGLDPDAAGPPGFVARHVIARAQMDDAVTTARPAFPYAQSANLAVRRAAFVTVGGFDEHARAGEDADLCFRLADAGWGLERRPLARVEHFGRTRLGPLLRQLAIHGSGAAWCERRHPGSFPAPTAAAFGRRLAGTARRFMHARLRGDAVGTRAAALEAAEAVAFTAGRALPNGTRRHLRAASADRHDPAAS